MRSRTVECHPTNVPSVETSPMLQRTQSRQTLVKETKKQTKF